MDRHRQRHPAWTTLRLDAPRGATRKARVSAGSFRIPTDTRLLAIDFAAPPLSIRRGWHFGRSIPAEVHRLFGRRAPCCTGHYVAQLCRTSKSPPPLMQPQRSNGRFRPSPTDSPAARFGPRAAVGQRPQFIRLVNAGGRGADIVLFGAGTGAAFSTAFSAAASHERQTLGSL